MMRATRLAGLLIAASAPAGELPQATRHRHPRVVEILATQAGLLKPQDSQPLPERGLGSGFTIARDRLVMTAARVASAGVRLDTVAQGEG